MSDENPMGQVIQIPFGSRTTKGLLALVAFGLLATRP